MRITTKAHYATTALLDLALHQEKGPVALPEIAERQNISLSYLEQLFAKLRREGLVASMRGRGGGYLLGRDPATISIANVTDAMDERAETTCQGQRECEADKTCLSHHLWMDLSDHIHGFLAGISLADLISQKREDGDAGELMSTRSGSDRLPVRNL